MASSTQVHLIMDPATKKFLTEGSYLSGSVDATGSAKCYCILNLNVLMEALDRVLPTINVYRESEEVVTGLNELVSSGPYNLPPSQPLSAGLWLNNGALTFFNGASNTIIDTVNEADPNAVVDEALINLPLLP